jgi:hypothetical protein
MGGDDVQQGLSLCLSGGAVDGLDPERETGFARACQQRAGRQVWRQDLCEFAQDRRADFDARRFACGVADVELDYADGITAIGCLAAQPVAADAA